MSGMPSTTDFRALRCTPLFDDLPDEHLRDIFLQLHCRTFPANTNVISFQMPGDVLYIIHEGTLKIKVDQADGKEVIIALLGQGEVVGELSMIDGSQRSADVFAQEASTLFWVDRATFERLLAAYPQLQRNLLRVLTRRVRLSTEQIQALATLDVPGKVERQLLVFADQYGVPREGRAGKKAVEIPMRLTQSDLAGMVGASRERVNQAFSSMKERGLIAVSNTYRITIQDLDRLRRDVQMR